MTLDRDDHTAGVNNYRPSLLAIEFLNLHVVIDEGQKFDGSITIQTVQNSDFFLAARRLEKIIRVPSVLNYVRRKMLAKLRYFVSLLL